jgi:hypothetical protein
MRTREADESRQHRRDEDSGRHSPRIPAWNLLKELRQHWSVPISFVVPVVSLAS